MNEVGTIPEEKEVLKSEVKYDKTIGKKCGRSLERKESVGEEDFRDERISLKTSLSLVSGKVDNSTENEVLQFIKSLVTAEYTIEFLRFTILEIKKFKKSSALREVED